MQRVIYSVELELVAGLSPESKVLIVRLGRHGNAQKSYVLGKPRMIDVRVGDTIQHPNGRFEVIGVKAWRETYLADGNPRPRTGI